MQKYIGIMSGTSLDGVDTALVATDGKRIQLLDHHFTAYPEDLKQQVLNICLGQETNLQQIGEIDHRLGLLFSDASLQLMDKAHIQAQDICAIGSHGQTVFHQPQGRYPFTLQLGDANLIAAKTGVTTVADFRRKDMAFGGQGAPLVPAFHHALFSHIDTNIVVLNIGGIANISVIQTDNTYGYDTGPGNMLMDAWVMQHTGQPYDKNGAFARQGQISDELLQRCMQDGYILAPAPKSTGRERFNLPWLEQQLTGLSLSAVDVQATLLEFTAQSITHEVQKFSQDKINELLVCGGGAQNPLLMMRLAELLPDWQLDNTLKYGIDSDYMEAMAFAWLAHQTMHQQAGNLPAVTGASQTTVLGAIYNAK